ncbi:transporter [Enterobacter cloacae]|uniref:transporter n=1 Tax=Enterobacter TaxID=547 RepID=UPI000D1D52C3|nr:MULTISPECIES: transporter [Enterobacter]MBE4965101.1 transporter [Enterobacter cloacae complex sp. P24RS]MBJ6386158.1 transporter [Enterobacter cloacae]MBJ6403606.1 transporter [Enterobacter cloacae]MBJ6432944.1 transporter [Enterobacter cloacae]MBJ6455594.1 transporter [Enterobacter cloacae]
MQKSERHLVVAIIVLIAGLLLVLLPLYVRADNARDWQNLPKDTNLIFGYYNNVHTNTSLDGNLPADGASVDADVYVLRYAHSFDIDGRVSAIQVIQPYASVTASLDNANYLTGSLNHENLGDTQVVFAHNLFGGPALSVEEFKRWQPEMFLTGALWLTLPTGDYDSDNAINIGANRWAFKPELAFGVPLGPTWLELNSWVSFFTDNNDYQQNSRLEQRPLYTLEGHWSYTLSPALWLSLDSSWTKGGETRVDGTLQDDEQENVLLGGSLGFMLSPRFGGMIAYTDTTHQRDGSPDVTTWSFRLQYLW